MQRNDDKMCEFQCMSITTRGRWQYYGRQGAAEIDPTVMTVGSFGDNYACRHYDGGNTAYALTLMDGALDADYGRLFAKQVLPSQGAHQMLKRALRAATDDGFDSLIFTLYDKAASISTSETHVEAPNVRMQRAKRFIEHHAFEQLRLADIASELGLSPFTAVRNFRSATGKTPYAYLLEIRLQRALELLEKTGCSVQSIALQVGFPDAAYFSRFFKNSMACSPSEYRSARGCTNPIRVAKP